MMQRITPAVAWGLVVAAIAAGYVGWGWPGVVLGITVVVFWLLLQFSRSLRVMKNAAGRPVGQVDSAVMLHSRLKTGMTLLQVLQITRSLGEKVEPPPAGGDESWRWRDVGGANVTVSLRSGRLLDWSLQRDQAPS
jgi:hypothetical protein